MATWGSTPCHLDDVDDDEDEYRSEVGADEEDEQEECPESSSDDDIHIYSSSRNQCSYSNRKNQGRSDRVEALLFVFDLYFVEIYNQYFKII